MSESARPRALEIVAVATRLFARRGYDGVSVRDICAEMSVNCSTISYYFGGKRRLYLEVLREQFAARGRALDQAVARSADPREQLAALCETMRDLEAEHPHFSALLARESGGPGPEFQQVAREFEAGPGGRLAELIRNGQRQGVFRAGPRAEHLALVVGLMLNGLAAARVFESPDAPGATERDYFEAVKTIVLEGLLAPPGEAESGHRLGKQSAKPRGPLGR